jgi:hypothetical protein
LQEGAEEAAEPNEKAEAAGDDDEEDRVEDMLDNLDFEDVSDGELEAEEARGGGLQIRILYIFVSYHTLLQAV